MSVKDQRFTIDHLEYVRERSHRRKVHAGLRRLAHNGHGKAQHIRVVHEKDDSCCLAEQWVTTALRIRKALGDDGEKATYMLFLQEDLDGFLVDTR